MTSSSTVEHVDDVEDVEDVAKTYYNSGDADNFYFHVWGGEDIHIGVYERPDEPIREASLRTVERMAAKVPLTESSRVLDVGAGYGGAARYLAQRFGCEVVCLNLADVQNERNRTLTKAAGLEEKIRVVDGAFEDLPEPSASFDVVWCQDAILHSRHKPRVIAEVARVMRPGARFVFTDPMQSDDCAEGVLQAVLERIHLEALGSFALYRELCANNGLREVNVEPLTEHLVAHYSRVREELTRREEELRAVCSPEYIERMKAGLSLWVESGRAGHLAWGILQFEKPPS